MPNTQVKPKEEDKKKTQHKKTDGNQIEIIKIL